MGCYKGMFRCKCAGRGPHHAASKNWRDTLTTARHTIPCCIRVERWRRGSAWLPQGICLEATPSLQPCLKREQQQQHSTPGGMHCSSTLSTAGTLSLAAPLHKTVHQVGMPCMSLASACSLLCGPTTAILASCACARIEPKPSSTQLAWCEVPLTTDHARVLQHVAHTHSSV
jgi:hypothetical protein